jgi:hypothetical protein
MLRFILCLLIAVSFSCNRTANKKSIETTEDTIAVSDYSPNINLDYVWWQPRWNAPAVISPEILLPISSGGPMVVEKDESGKYWITAWDDAVNFEIDPDCADKRYLFRVPVDTAMLYLSSSETPQRYLSLNHLFEMTGKRFVVKEVNEEDAQDGVVYEQTGINLYYKAKRSDSLIVESLVVRDVFEKKTELYCLVYNLHSRSVEQIDADIIVSEFEDQKSKKPLGVTRKSGINLLDKSLPAYSTQLIKKHISGFAPSGKSSKTFRYYNDEKKLNYYKFKGDTAKQQFISN